MLLAKITMSIDYFRIRDTGLVQDGVLCGGIWWKFTKPQRRGQGQRRLKLNLYFSDKSRDTLTVKTITKLNAKHSDKFEIKIKRIVRRGSRSLENADLGYLNVLAQPLFCSLIHLFSSVAVAVLVVVSLTPHHWKEINVTWFAFEKTPRISLNCMLVPVHYREYDRVLLQWAWLQLGFCIGNKERNWF